MIRMYEALFPHCERDELKRLRLKPHVYKIEGAVNFAFYNMLAVEFSQYSPEGSVHELRKSLLEAGLAFETEGAVPHKTVGINMWSFQNEIQIRTLQIRLNGRQADNCWNRSKYPEPYKIISDEILEHICLNCLYIPIDTIRIEAEKDDPEKIEKILKNIDSQRVELFVEEGLSASRVDGYRKQARVFEFEHFESGEKDISEPIVDTFNFFYTKHYNPCIGHQVAIDTAGQIKYCLWSDQELGNLVTDNLKDLIIGGAFDEYWEMSKDRIDLCKECELRYNCNDCRVDQLKNNHSMDSKPSFCNYDPLVGA